MSQDLEVRIMGRCGVVDTYQGTLSSVSGRTTVYQVGIEGYGWTSDSAQDGSLSSSLEVSRRGPHV